MAQELGTGGHLAYVNNGQAQPLNPGDVVGFAPIRLHHGATVTELSATANPGLAEVDNADFGYFLDIRFIDAPANPGGGLAWGAGGVVARLALRGCVVDYG